MTRIDGNKIPAHIHCIMPKRKKKLSPEEMREFIHSLRGSLKRKPGDKPFAEEWAEYKRREKALEESKFERCFGRRSSLKPG